MIKGISTVFLFVIIISAIPIGDIQTEHIGKNTLGPEAAPHNLAETKSFPVLAQVTGEIKFDNDEEHADVGPGENGVVVFPGTVTVNAVGPGQSFQLIFVELSVNAQGLECSVSPSSLTFQASQTGTAQPFQAVIRVPNFTSCTEEYRVRVTGTATTEPGTQSYPLDPADGMVKVNQYCMAKVTPEVQERSIRGGGEEWIRVEVQNTGNGQDGFRFAVQGSNALEEKGITFEVDSEQTMVPEGSTAEMSMKISVSEKAPEGKIMIEFHIISSESKAYSSVGVGKIELDIEQEPSFFSADNWVLYAAGVAVILIIVGIVFIFIRRKKEHV